MTLAEILSIVEIFVLSVTLIIVYYYTVETARLRRSAQKQSELFKEQLELMKKSQDIADLQRADPFRGAVYAKVIQGFQEFSSTINDLVNEREAVISAFASHDHSEVITRVEDKIKELDSLRWKWLPFLPTAFITDVDNFKVVYRKWFNTTRNADKEGLERSSELFESLSRIRSSMMGKMRSVTPTDQMLEDARRIVKGT
jgi:uncharacterized protein YpmB